MPDIFKRLYKFARKTRRFSLVLLTGILLAGNLQAQTEETADTSAYDESYKQDSSYQSPRKAAIMSAIIPGLGQIYNKKYWKVPIIYIGFGTFAYFIHYNQQGYLEWKQAYIDFPDYKLKYDFPLTLDQIDRTKNSFKRYRDLSIIGTAGFFLLQIIDATVDAYLFDWDVSENLTLKVEPSLIPPPSVFPLPAANTFALKASVSF